MGLKTNMAFYIGDYSTNWLYGDCVRREWWKYPVFKREYIFIDGPFSIAMQWMIY